MAEVKSKVKEEPKEFDSTAYYNERIPFRREKLRGGKSDDIFIGWCGQTFRIKRGETVMIPRGAVIVYEESERALDEAERRREAMGGK